MKLHISDISSLNIKDRLKLYDRISSVDKNGKRILKQLGLDYDKLYEKVINSLGEKRKLVKLPQKSNQLFIKQIIANNNPVSERVLKEFDFAQFGKEGLPLKYSRADFNSKVEELLKELTLEGYNLTQATLSRDLKQLKVAKAASISGKYIYVLPNNTLYKRISEPHPIANMPISNGFISLRFSGNVAVIRTRPGYASSIAYDIDNGHIEEILGTIAGADTVFAVLREDVTHDQAMKVLQRFIPINSVIL